MAAVTEVDNLKDVLSDVRKNVEVYHCQWFAEVEKMCNSVQIQPSLPRQCACQSHRCNVPAQNPSEYYRRTVTIPVLDHLLSEMKSRFSMFSIHQKTALLGLYLIPSIFVTKTFNEIVEKLDPLEKMYASDLKDDTFQNELHLWYVKWEKEKNLHGENALPTSLFHTLPHASSYYPNIGILLRILCTLPVTSCSSERSFSALKHVKTALRSTMSDERLTSLTLLHVHRAINIEISDIIDEFARHHPRRIRLANIFQD